MIVVVAVSFLHDHFIFEASHIDWHLPRRFRVSDGQTGGGAYSNRGSGACRYQSGFALQLLSEILAGGFLQFTQTDRMFRGLCYCRLHRRRHDRGSQKGVSTRRVDNFGNAELVVIVHPRFSGSVMIGSRCRETGGGSESKQIFCFFKEASAGIGTFHI